MIKHDINQRENDIDSIIFELEEHEFEYEVEESFISKLKTVPNIPEDDVPVGLSEDENVVAEVCGEPTK